VPTQNGAVGAVWNKQYWSIDKSEISYPEPPRNRDASTSDWCHAPWLMRP
jgi:hypothetical protein